MNRVICCIILLMNLSCENVNKNRKENIEALDTSTYRALDDVKISLNLAKAINTGDSIAYDYVSHYYLLSETWPEFYYYALIMANKYNYTRAHYDLYLFLNDKINIDGIDLYSTDPSTRTTCLFHLIKAYEGGYEPSIDAVRTMFPKGNIPSSKTLCLQ